MKKIHLISAAILGIFAAASCNREAEVNTVLPEEGRTVIHATVESSKTALGDKEGTAYPNYWKEGDQISVNGVASDALDAEADGEASADFSFDAVLDTPYYAVYPASAVSGYSAGSATLTVPSVQNYVEGSYDPAAFLMTGKSDVALSVSLSACVSIFHLSISGDASISRIVLAGAGDAALSGTFTTDFSVNTPAETSAEVEIVSEVPVALPAEFFFCVPAGLSGAVTLKVFDTEGGSMVKNATITDVLQAGRMYSSELEYEPSFAPVVYAEGITSSTAVVCWDNAPVNAYTVGVYADSGCSALLDSFAVEAGDPCWAGDSPRFCISGLAPSTTYYVKVTDNTNAVESDVLPVTTAAFSVVEASDTPASVGDVLLAEDFGELRWDCDMVGNGAGFFPTAQDNFANSEVLSYQAAATSSEKMLSSQGTALAASRLAHWAQGANANLYIHPGYIKLVGSSKVTHVVTPALDNIPEGKVATLEVEVTASRYYSASSDSYATEKAVVAVQAPGEINELVDETKTNTLDLTTNIQAITLPAEVAWNTFKVTLTGVTKGSRIAFGAASDVTGNNARMNLSDIKVTVKALDDPAPVALTASLETVSSSTASFSWTYGGDAADDIAKPYTVAVYSNADCSSLVVSHDIAAEASCWGGRVPCLSIGGLAPSTTYWFVATDTENNIASNVVEVTTEAFTVVDATVVANAAVGDVILAEDFSEIGWGPEQLAVAAGFVPSTKNLTIPSGENPEGGYTVYDNTGNRLFGSGVDIDGSRLSKGWGFFGNSSVYLGNAYLRVSSSTGRTLVVTPKLSGIPEGKLATLEVELTASKYETSTNDIAVFVEKGLTLNGATDPGSSSFRKYTGVSYSNSHALGITKVKEWETKSVIIANVDSDCQLVIGSLESEKNRFFISDVKVTITALKDPGTIDAEMDIEDYATFKAFLEACGPGKTVKGNVVADIALTSGQVAEIDALYPVEEFDGILNGNNHTITGLTKPLFQEFSGTADDLTLNSTLNITDEIGNVGIFAGSLASGAALTNVKTQGSITHNSASALSGAICLGGIAGSASDATLTSCSNEASITNSSNSGGGLPISIGGLVGDSSAEITSSYNAGALSNSGVPDEDVCLGGVVGINSGQTLTSCYNTGSVNNSGDSKSGYNVSVGGLVGWSSAGSVYVTCYNEGSVENSGNGSNTGATAPGARVAGLIATASGANTLSGDADNYNYNNGTVYEHSASARAAVSGICAWANNASTSLDYARNLEDGDITVQDGEYTNVYIGGVLGVETAAASFNYTKNAGDISIRNITLTKAAYIGGVHGGFTANGAQTITGCENTGAIDCPDSGGKSENMKSTSSANVVTYIGGISSGAGNDAARTGKTFTNCVNRGAITMYNQCWTRLGGVIGYANQNSSGCENHGKIVYYRMSGGYNSSNGAVGGVIGYINIASVSNLTNTGGVQSTGSSPNCYTGGIVGQEGGNMNTMTNCNVGKSGINIVGAGSGSFGSNGAGLFVASGSKKAWTFTGCKVITGTKCQGTVITDTNMADAVVGRNHASSITDPPTIVDSF